MGDGGRNLGEELVGYVVAAEREETLVPLLGVKFSFGRTYAW